MDNGAIRLAISEANRRAELRGYKSGDTAWKRGMLGPITIPNAGVVQGHIVSIVAGLLGEYAWATVINRRIGRRVCEVDFRLLSCGDGDVDLCPMGLPIQVKTRTKDYGKHLVRVARADGREVPLHADVYAFAEWNRFRQVRLYGWCWRKEFKEMPLARGVGDHWNVEVFDENTKPVCRLIDELRSRD